MARATGVKDVIEAHQQARGVIKSDRKRARIAIGSLAQCFAAAMQIWDEQKASGVPILERIGGLRKTLEAAWPSTREWKYVCTQCDDYGLVIASCPGVANATCGRVKPHMPHDYGTPCWCQRGRAFKEKPKADPEDFTAAGRMTKVGRRQG